MRFYKPKNMPADPNKAYKGKGWVSLYDFLGKNNDFNLNWISYEDLKFLIAPLKFSNQNEYKEWARLNRNLKNIPINPNLAYKEEWKGWGDFLGTGNIFKGDWFEYNKAKDFIQPLDIPSVKEYRKYIKNNKPIGIPSKPERIYKGKGWTCWADFLGTNNRINIAWISYRNLKFLIFPLKFNNQDEYRKWARSKKNTNIPISPHIAYKEEWEGWDKFLGKENKKMLIDIFPELKDLWHPAKNGYKKFTDIPMYPKNKIWLRRTECQHEWQINPGSKLRNKENLGKCPICYNKNNCVANFSEKLRKEWHPTKNGSIKANNITTGSSFKIWWICQKCKHEWQATPSNRCCKKSGCPACAGKCKNNSRSKNQKSSHQLQNK